MARAAEGAHAAALLQLTAPSQLCGYLLHRLLLLRGHRAPFGPVLLCTTFDWHGTMAAACAHPCRAVFGTALRALPAAASRPPCGGGRGAALGCACSCAGRCQVQQLALKLCALLAVTGPHIVHEECAGTEVLCNSWPGSCRWWPLRISACMQGHRAGEQGVFVCDGQTTSMLLFSEAQSMQRTCVMQRTCCQPLVALVALVQLQCAS